MRTVLTKVPLKDALNYFSANWDSFQIRLTNYTMTVTVAPKEKYFFADNIMSKKVFIWYHLIKKSNEGEIREIPTGYKYFDFAGAEKIKEGDSDIYCIDINSAYLSVLLRDKIVTQKDFDTIMTKGQKKHRLQALGMFAKNPVIIDFKKGVPTEYKTDTDPFKWIFYHAVNETFLAMDAVKKKMLNEFLFYWVDGIFIRGDPNRAVNILKEMGFDSKIERVKNIKIKERVITFDKYSAKKNLFEKKILFLPKSNKIDKKDLISQLKRAVKI